jgi:putative transposase
LTYYERHLPHWHPEGTALFVTWRLHGSLPRTVQFVRNQPAGKAFVAVDRQLDGAAAGPRWLADHRVAEVVATALRFGSEELGLYDLRAWVLMINHVHILIYPKVPLPKITKAIKNYSARQANAILGRSGQPFWHDESYDHWVRGQDELERIVLYIEANPVAAGLTTRVEDWRWSSGFRETA